MVLTGSETWMQFKDFLRLERVFHDMEFDATVCYADCAAWRTFGNVFFSIEFTDTLELANFYGGALHPLAKKKMVVYRSELHFELRRFMYLLITELERGMGLCIQT